MEFAGRQMADTDPAAAALVVRLLSCLDIDKSNVLAACMNVHHAYSGKCMPAETASLTAAHKALQLKALPERKKELQDIFMQMVSKDTGSLLYVLAEIGKNLRDVTLSNIAGTGAHSPLPPTSLSVGGPQPPSSPGLPTGVARSLAAYRDLAPRPKERTAEPSVDAGLSHRMNDVMATSSGQSGMHVHQDVTAESHPVSHVGKLLMEAAAYLSKFDEVSGCGSEPVSQGLLFGNLIVLQSYNVANGCLFVQTVDPTHGKVHCHSSGVGLPQEVFRLVPALGNRHVGDVIRHGDLVHIQSYEWSQYLAPSALSVGRERLPGACTPEAVRVDASISAGLNTAFVVYSPDCLSSLQTRPPSAILSSQRLVFLGHAADSTSDRSTAIRSMVLRRFALQAFSSSNGKTTVALDILRQGPSGRDGLASEFCGSPPSAMWGFRPVSKYARSSVGPALFVHAALPAWAYPALPGRTSLNAFNSAKFKTGLLPLHVQEAVIIDSVLKALLGHASDYAVADMHGRFEVPQSVLVGAVSFSIDPSTRLLANQLLPLASLYAGCTDLCHALRSPSVGLVAQAFGAAARQILKEYVTLLVQVEATSRVGAKYCDSKGYLVRIDASVSSRPGNTPQTAAAPAIVWSMSLQRLWFYLQPSLRTLQALFHMLSACKGRRGGALISVLAHEMHSSGEEVTHTLATFLLEQAILPYFGILDKWIYQGVVHDLFGEFMIVEDVSVTAEGLKHDITNRYWDERFHLRPELAPSFLLPLQDLILTAGKYVHVLRLCNFGAPHASLLALQHAGTQQPSFVPATPIGSGTKPAVYSRESDSAAYTDEIMPTSSRVIRRVAQYFTRTEFLGLESDAYALKLHHAAASASRALLNHFVQAKSLGGLALFARLNSLKAFFFSAHGDFLTHFLDNAEEELAKELASSNKIGNVAAVTPGSLASINRLRTLFDLSFRNTTLETDPHRGEFSSSLAPSSLLVHLEMLKGGEAPGSKLSSSGLKGYNSFTLDFVADWPLSIVVTRNCVSKYQLLFRNILFAKYVEKAVCTCWVAHQSCKELGVRATMASSYALRQRMLHFLQNLIYYMLAEVIEPRWHEMLVTMRASTTIEDIIRSHEKFLDECLGDSLLSSHELMKLQTKLITLCLLFSQQITQSVESHRLTEQELDERAGLNRASKRARAALEKGDYYAGDDDEDASSVSSRVTAASRRRSTAAANPVVKDRTRRQARINVQTEAMQHTMAQHGWQAMIVKSSRMFDTLLREFLAALLEKTRGEFQSHLLHLCQRLDFNGFYTQHLQLIGLSEPA